MHKVRRLVDENGLVTDQFITTFNKPQTIGSVKMCNVIRKDQEQFLAFKQDVLEDLEQGTAEYAKVWLEVRKLALRAKSKNTRLRVLSYESEVRAGKRKYLTLLELA